MKLIVYRSICVYAILFAVNQSHAQSPELVIQTGHSKPVRTLAFSPNGKLLATSGDNMIKLWDVANGQEVGSITGHGITVVAIAFSPDGKVLASGSGIDNEIQLWDVASGRELKMLSGHAGFVISIRFSPDGRTLLSGSQDGTVRLWDLERSAEIAEKDGLLGGVAFSPDGKMIACDSAAGILLFDDHLKVLKSVPATSNNIISIEFSPDAKLLLIGSFHAIELWDLANSRRMRVFSSDTAGSAAFTPDGKSIAGCWNDSVKLWDVASGREIRSFSGDYRLAISPDGKILACRGTSSLVNLYEISTGKQILTLEGHSARVNYVTFSKDGKLLATANDEGIIKFWSTTGGQAPLLLSGHSESINSVAFSSDDTVLASGDVDDMIRLWDVETGKEIGKLSGNSEAIWSVAFSPDDKLLATGGGIFTGVVKVWDLATGKELRSLVGHGDSVYKVAFVHDGRELVTYSVKDKSKLWDVATGKELELTKSLPDWGLYRGDHRDFGTLTIGADPDNGRTNLTDFASDKKIGSLVELDDNDWLVVTPDGLFDGSPGAWRKIVWRFSNNIMDYSHIETYFGDFYYPGLMGDIIAGKNPRAPSDISKKDRRQPLLNFDFNEGTSNPMVSNRKLSLKIAVSRSPAGAQDVRLFRNGSLVKVWHGDVLKGKEMVALEATVPIVAGENRFTAYAFNHDNIKSQDATLTVTGADSLKRKGVLYILAAGVDQYANAEYNLKYAVADAKDFSDEVKKQQETLGTYERVEVIPLYDRDATKANFLKALADIQAKVQPEDGVFIYFSGHGAARGDRFYLIPHDLGYQGSRTRLDQAGLQMIFDHGISDEDLQHALEGIDAGQMLLVIDACNSGQALESAEKRRGPMNSKGLAQLAYEKGMYILTAAQSYQAALEASKLGHGYLTYALVEEGLKTNAADTEPKDGLLLLREWLDYATNRVPQMQQAKLEEGRGRQLQLVVEFTNGEETLDPSQRTVQRPRVFYRRELEPQPMVVARPH